MASNQYSHGSIGHWFYNLYTQNVFTSTLYGASGTVDHTAKRIFAVTSNGTFVTDGVQAGDILEMDSPGEGTATVLEVISETQLYTTTLSGSGTYDSGDGFTITRDGDIISSASINSTNPNTIFCRDADADFINQKVMVGDTVTMTVGGETATVNYVSTLGEFVRTTALSGSGTYASAEAFTIADGTIIRLIAPPATNKRGFVRKVTGKSDKAAAALSIYKGNQSNTAAYVQSVGTSLFELEPTLSPGEETTPIIVELDYTSAASMNFSYEVR